jgi:hypothetical protein
MIQYNLKEKSLPIMVIVANNGKKVVALPEVRGCNTISTVLQYHKYGVAIPEPIWRINISDMRLEQKQIIL